MAQAAAGTARTASARTLALVALVAEALPSLLPLYGNDQFLFSLGLPVRSVISAYVSGWAIACAVGVGLIFLRRGWGTLAAGAFVGLGLVITFSVASMLIAGDVFSPWQSALVFFLRLVAAAALLAAAAMLTRQLAEA